MPAYESALRQECKRKSATLDEKPAIPGEAQKLAHRFEWALRGLRSRKGSIHMPKSSQQGLRGHATQNEQTSKFSSFFEAGFQVRVALNSNTANYRCGWPRMGDDFREDSMVGENASNGKSGTGQRVLISLSPALYARDAVEEGRLRKGHSLISPALVLLN